MATFIWDNIVFGPITSRRFGISLGMNLLPEGRKICTFDCVYCECGWTESADFENNKMPTSIQVFEALESKLQEMNLNNQYPDAITFAGNGEPTLHPDFLKIIEDTVSLRNKYCPKAKITVLTNSTLLTNSSVCKALSLIDNPVLKLDSGIEETFNLINLPKGNVNYASVIQSIIDFPENKIIQTMFLRGMVNGKNIDNTSEIEVNAWIQKLHEIKPSKIMIYAIDRDTPAKNLEKIGKDELEKIANKARNEGFQVSVA